MKDENRKNKKKITKISPYFSPVSCKSESVKCRFSKCRFSVLNLKFDFISDGGCTREKQIQKALGSLPPCGNRCRFSESATCSSRVRPPSEIKSNFKFKTLRWRPLRWRLTLSEQTFRGRTSLWGTTAPNNGVSQLSYRQRSYHEPLRREGRPGKLCATCAAPAIAKYHATELRSC